MCARFFQSCLQQLVACLCAGTYSYVVSEMGAAEGFARPLLVIYIASVLPKNNSRHDGRVWFGRGLWSHQKLLVSFLLHIKEKSVLKACRADMP